MQIKGYSFSTSLVLFFNLLKTKILYPRSRLIRSGFRVRGIKNIDFGRNLTTGVGCRIDCFSDKSDTIIFFGENVQINDYVHIAGTEKIKIGNNVLIASRVFISDHNHGNYSGEYHSSPLQPPALRKIFSSPVIIENNVWIGEGVSILPNVKIGTGSIIGANSVVTKSIPDYVIAAGIPAKPIKYYDFSSKKWISFPKNKKIKNS